MAEYRKADTIEVKPLSDAEEKARRARNVAIAVALVALVGVFYWSTVVKFGPAAMDRPEITLAPDRSVADPDFQGVAPKEPMPGQPVHGQPATVPATGGSPSIEGSSAVGGTP